MEHWLVGALLAGLGGVLISYLSYLLSRQVLKKKPNLFSAVTVPRQIIQIGYLAVVYFLQPMTPWGLVALLVGAAMGLTVAMFFFTKSLLNTIRHEETGGDENG